MSYPNLPLPAPLPPDRGLIFTLDPSLLLSAIAVAAAALAVGGLLRWLLLRRSDRGAAIKTRPPGAGRRAA